MMGSVGFHLNNDKTHRANNGALHLKTKVRYILLAILICEVYFMKPHFRQLGPEETKTVRAQQNDDVFSAAVVNDVSTAPLFYHISPGSTGSRTLYHAACSAGLPSVHHKSFCISDTRGIEGVNKKVVKGVRAHFEVLRLHEMAVGCLKAKSKLFAGVSSNKDYTLVSFCNMSIDEWSANLQTHLSTVLKSDLVGLFDTPYPYLAPQIMNLIKLWRPTAIIGMTQRDPSSWVNSRTKHGLLLCRKEHSFDDLGSSEFDIFGCINNAKRNSINKKSMHFWDVFWYRSHHEEMNSEFVEGMVHQMERHQKMYLPFSTYTPDFFGEGSNTDKSRRIDEKTVATDISQLLLNESAEQHVKHINKSLTCRGRVNWEMSNDTFIEIYHLPKTCTQKKNGAVNVPLIQQKNNSLKRRL